MESRRFLITGGSHGIGAALVGRAREAGHDVVFTGRHDDTIAQITAKTGAFGLRADSSETSSTRQISPRRSWPHSTYLAAPAGVAVLGPATDRGSCALNVKRC